MKCAQVFGFCVFLSLATVQAASAEPVLFSTLAAGDTYNTNFIFTIGGPVQPIRQAQLFTPTAEGRVNTLELGLVLFSGADRVVAELLTNVDNQPGSVIESFLFTGLPLERGSGQSALLSAGSVLSPLLTTETSYWLRVGPGDLSTTAGWNASSFRVLVPHWLAIGSDVQPVQPNQLAAFRLTGETGNPIPEPGTMLLVGSALGIAALRRRTRPGANA